MLSSSSFVFASSVVDDTYSGNSVLVRKCFIKHMCFIVLYFHSHAFFLLEIVKKCFIVLYF